MYLDSFNFSVKLSQFSARLKSIKSGALLHLFTLSPGLIPVFDTQKLFKKQVWNEGRIDVSSFACEVTFLLLIKLYDADTPSLIRVSKGFSLLGKPGVHWHRGSFLLIVLYSEILENIVSLHMKLIYCITVFIIVTT